MNFSYNSFCFSPSASTFFIIIWSIVTTFRIGFAAAVAASEKKARAERLAKEAQQDATDAEAAYNASTKAEAAAKTKADDWETEALKRHKDAQNATAEEKDAEEKVKAAMHAAKLKKIKDKAAADLKAAKAAADKAAGSRATAANDTKTMEADEKTLKEEHKTAKTDAQSAHEAAKKSAHAEWKAAKTAHAKEVWDAKKMAIPLDNITGAVPAAAPPAEGAFSSPGDA